MRAALDLLPEPTRSAIDDLHVRYGYDNGGAFPPRQAATDEPRILADVIHPLVRSHARAESTSLFLDLDRAKFDESLPNATITLHDGVARFESLEAWIHTDVRGWTLADMIDHKQYEQLVAAARQDLAQFVGGDGRVRFAAPALIATDSTSSTVTR